MMVTRNGTVKRIPLDALKTARKAGIRALTLDEGDELICVRETDGSQEDPHRHPRRHGHLLRRDRRPPHGPDAAGVRGIRLRDGDYVVGAARAKRAKSC